MELLTYTGCDLEINASSLLYSIDALFINPCKVFNSMVVSVWISAWFFCSFWNWNQWAHVLIIVFCVCVLFSMWTWYQLKQDHPLNLSILVRGGKESNYDFFSNGEWTRNCPRLNRNIFINLSRSVIEYNVRTLNSFTSCFVLFNDLEESTIEG